MRERRGRYIYDTSPQGHQGWAQGQAIMKMFNLISLSVNYRFRNYDNLSSSKRYLMQRLYATAWLIWCNIFVFVKVFVQLIGMQHSTSMFISYKQYKLMTKVEVILLVLNSHNHPKIANESFANKNAPTELAQPPLI